MKMTKEWDQVLNYFKVWDDGLTDVESQFSDNAATVVRNVVFLKHHGKMLLSVYIYLKKHLAETYKIHLVWKIHLLLSELGLQAQLNEISPSFNLSCGLTTSSNISGEHCLFKQTEPSSSASRCP